MSKALPFRRDRNAQVHVMEVVTATMLVISAIQALVSANVAGEAEDIDLTDMKVLAEDSLRVLEQMTVEDPSYRYDNVLEMHLTNGDHELLRENLSALIPSDYSFNLYLSNWSYTHPLGEISSPIGDAVVGYRLVNLRYNPYPVDGNVLTIELLIWREVR